jgi:glycosyltransferase involved in cell wall biosynthesis
VRYLWLSGDVPYPSDSGRRAYSAGLSESVASTGVEVIGLGLADARTEIPDCRVDWRPLPAHGRPGAIRRMFSRWPSMAVDRRVPSYRRAVEDLGTAAHIDVVIVDHLQMAWAPAGLGSRELPVVYVSHNHEATVRRGVAAGEPWTSARKPALAYDAERAARAERRLVESATVVSAITESDATRYRNQRATDVVVVPPGYGGTRCGSRTIDAAVPRVAVMVANLDWHVKQTNLRRLLAVADPLFAQAGVTLRLVGPAPDDFVAAVSPTLRATEFVGHAPALDDELAQARVGLVFEPEGGGFKMKCLDYVFRRVPIVALAGSVEGLPLEPGAEYLSFESTEDLARGVIALIDDVGRCEQLQERAFRRCSGAFDWADRGEILVAHIAEAAAR